MTFNPGRLVRDTSSDAPDREQQVLLEGVTKYHDGIPQRPSKLGSKTWIA